MSPGTLTFPRAESEADLGHIGRLCATPNTPNPSPITRPSACRSKSDSIQHCAQRRMWAQFPGRYRFARTDSPLPPVRRPCQFQRSPGLPGVPETPWAQARHGRRVARWSHTHACGHTTNGLGFVGAHGSSRSLRPPSTTAGSDECDAEPAPDKAPDRVRPGLTLPSTALPPAFSRGDSSHLTQLRVRRYRPADAGV